MLTLRHLNTGAGHIAVECNLVEAAGIRSRFEPFVTTTSQSANALLVRRGEVTANGMDLPGLNGSLGRVHLISQHELVVDLASDPYAAIAVVRLAWHLVTVRHGGVLIHAGAAGFGGRAVISTGASGAGKTTLTKCLLQAGATLLSDEIIAVFPDGSARGTPFRSDLDLPGTPERFQIGGVLLLAKGDHERVDEVSPRELIQTVMSQAFTPEGGELTRSEALSRVTRAFSNARTGRLTFRKDPAAGIFVRDWLNAPRG